MNMSIGIVELLIIFIVAVLSLALPVAVIFFLYKIYARLKGIEEQLRKNTEVSKRDQV